MINFEKAYEDFMRMHMIEATGERLRKLREHGYLEKLLLEKVWWPAIGNFDHLYPEYEVLDFKDGDRFLDYAFLDTFTQICLEGDGFNPHTKDKWKFSDDRNRQNDLVIDGWTILRFAHDDIVNNPRKCQMKLQQLMGKLILRKSRSLPDSYSFLERAIIRFAAYSKGTLTPVELERYLGMGQRKVNKLIGDLIEKKVIEAIGNGKRIRSYRLIIKDISPFLQL